MDLWEVPDWDIQPSPAIQQSVAAGAGFQSSHEPIKTQQPAAVDPAVEKASRRATKRRKKGGEHDQPVDAGASASIVQFAARPQQRIQHGAQRQQDEPASRGGNAAAVGAPGSMPIGGQPGAVHPKKAKERRKKRHMQALAEDALRAGISSGGGQLHDTGETSGGAEQPARRNKSKRNKFKQVPLQGSHEAASDHRAASGGPAGASGPAERVITDRPATEGAARQEGSLVQIGKRKRHKPEHAPAAEPAEQREQAALAVHSKQEPCGSTQQLQRQHAAQNGRAEAKGRNEAGGEEAGRGLAASRQDAAAAGPREGTRPGTGGGLLERMRAQLSGGRFRWLNELLYSCPGEEALALMQGQPELFRQYHKGFQSQTARWPVQPIDAAAAYLRRRPAAAVVADFGCGDAALARVAPQETVHSLDLVAAAPGVIACNMAATPLESASVDVAVFCLALMGTDYPAFLAEAHRVLKPGGYLWIAEVRSRFAGADGHGEDFAPFLDALCALGFKDAAQDASNSHFVTFVLRKTKGSGGSHGGGGDWPRLKPCTYKKR